MPNATLVDGRRSAVDGLRSSESGTLAKSVTSSGETAETARFHLGTSTRVIDENGADVAGPKQVFEVPSIGPAANGKLDYRALAESADAFRRLA